MTAWRQGQRCICLLQGTLQQCTGQQSTGLQQASEHRPAWSGLDLRTTMARQSRPASRGCTAKPDCPTAVAADTGPTQLVCPSARGAPCCPLFGLCTKALTWLQVTGAVGWRKDNLKYKKNEVFLDIVEQVNMLTSAQGAVLRCDVNGKVVMKVFLSGMPDVKLGLNDALEVCPCPQQSGHKPCMKLSRAVLRCGVSGRVARWASRASLWHAPCDSDEHCKLLLASAVGLALLAA